MFIRLQDGTLLNLNYVVRIEIQAGGHNRGGLKVVLHVDNTRTKRQDVLVDISEEQAQKFLDSITTQYPEVMMR